MGDIALTAIATRALCKAANPHRRIGGSTCLRFLDCAGSRFAQPFLIIAFWPNCQCVREDAITSGEEFGLRAPGLLCRRRAGESP
jgi:hypothetical protein